MATTTDDQIRGLVNALQLCIRSQIMSWDCPKFTRSRNVLAINFAPRDPDDPNLAKFELLAPGRWVTPENKSKIHNYFVQNLDQIDVGLLTHFLLLTRLQDKQVWVLAEQDNRYRTYARALGLFVQEKNTLIISLTQMRDLIFQTIDEKKFSLSMLARQTKLSQVSLSNFKAGGDIRFSNLLKIVKALGIKLTSG